MELGVADSIQVAHITADGIIEQHINAWLKNNADVEVLDIKFSSSLDNGEWYSDALIIFRKE